MKSASLLNPWIWKTAWRDSRPSRRRLLLFISSMVLGVAALVAIASFRSNLEDAVNQQARAMVGADLVVSSNRDLEASDLAFLDELAEDLSLQTSFSSMAYFPKVDGFRLSDVRAIRGNFPYYGEIVTEPQQAGSEYKSGPYALVDDVLMRQFEVQVGETVKLGEFVFTIAGRLLDIPGESTALSIAAPRIYIPLDYLDETGLIQTGSRVGYRAYLKLPEGADPDQLVEDREQEFRDRDLRTDTVERRKRRLGRAMENLGRFLNLVGFIALILGGIGIASATHLYVRQKLPIVAILRCLGCTSRQAFTVYTIQAFAMGLMGTLGGALLGLGVQHLLPVVLKDFLPVDLEVAVSWVAVVEGALTGLVLTSLFSLLPLVRIRRVSPLSAIRMDYEPGARKWDPLQIMVSALLGGAVLAFAVAQNEQWWVGVFFFLGLAFAFGLLAGFAKIIMVLVRRFFPASWPYVWRQGLANLYRPQNQTLILMLSLGLATFLILTLYLTQSTLLSQAELVGSEGNPNLVFFDIQPSQREGVIRIVQEEGVPVLQDVPIVTMRLASLKGRSIRELREDESRTQPRWALAREYRSTYRDQLTDTEKVIDGAWTPRVSSDVERVPISLEEEIARELDVKVGDELIFDVQGLPVQAVVGSIRKVEWERFQPNFFALFPAGVLEEAPQFHVIVTRVDTPQQTAELQRKVVNAFPNVSTIDLGFVLRTIDEILDRVAFVIQFMALFSVVTGLTVLVGAVITSRFQRMRETILLRTLGASRRQVLHIMLVEYTLLGLLAACTGLLLALGAGWGLATFLFETTFRPPLLPISGTVGLIVLLTLLIGLLNSRGILDRPPLEVLRNEG